MARDLGGNVVAITGASSGIGEATAVACAARGMRVGLFARRAGRLEAVAEKVEAAGGQAEIVAGDVRERSALVGLMQACARRWGRLDAVIANAGFGMTAPVAGTPPEEVREIFEVNVLGTIWALQAAWPFFELQRRGHAVIVSSVVAKHSIPLNALYSATKAAQASLAQGMRSEAREIGVEVSVVYPVRTETEFAQVLRHRTEGPRGFRGPRQSAAHVGRAIVDCLERPRLEVYPYGPVRLLPWLEALSPTFTDRFLRFPQYFRRQRRNRA